MVKSEHLIKEGIDETDRRIISALVENSRMSYRQVAKKLMISAATVMHRVQRLQSSGIIKKYTVNLDYDKLGFDISVCIDIRVAKGKLFEVERQIAKLPNAQAVYDITGAFDAIVIAKFRNRRELDAFVKKIQTYDFVERTETRLVLNTIKEGMIQI